jgi:type IV pilus assembly protein PilM
MHSPLIYKPKPIFGLDIGAATAKVAQLKASRGQISVSGYGYVRFESSAVKDGVIVKPEQIAQVLKPFLKEQITGRVTTNRVVASVPVARSYTRIFQLPTLSPEDTAEAVKLEAEQYIPAALDELYVEHLALETNPKAKTHPVLLVATPKKIVDSYLSVLDHLRLEVDAVEPNLFANFRTIKFLGATNEPKIIIDFGALSSDLAAYDKSVRLTSTVNIGSDTITETIAKVLKIDEEQALKVKYRFGIAKSRWQAQLANALQPFLSTFANEVQKVMRYYHEHSENKTAISQILLVGGGSNMPGLSDFLAHLTGVTVANANPWNKLVVKPLQPPHPSEAVLYATAIGLALKGVGND